MYEKSNLARTFGDLWRLIDVAEQEREMAWAIEKYECCKKLQKMVQAAVWCVTKQEKQELLAFWQLALPEDEVDQVLKILKNKDATKKVLNWKLIDPRH